MSERPLAVGMFEDIARLQREAATLRQRLLALQRYDVEEGSGCDDPDCCGGPGIAEYPRAKGEWVRWTDLRAALDGTGEKR